MTFKEQLKELKLTEEKSSALLSALNEEYIEKTEQKRTSDSLKAAKAECERLSDNLSAVRNEYKKNIEFIKQSAADKLERLKGLYDLRLKDRLIDLALTESGAKSCEIVRKLIDEDKVELKEDKLTGLSTQLSELKKKAPFLFEKKIMYLTGYIPEPSSDLLPIIAPADMTYSQALAYLEKE